MELYLCNVYDGIKQTWVGMGVFSTEAKALEAGGLYIVENAHGNARLLDWEEELPTLKYWYQDDNHNPFTRIVLQCKVDERLV